MCECGWSWAFLALLLVFPRSLPFSLPLSPLPRLFSQRAVSRYHWAVRKDCRQLSPRTARPKQSSAVPRPDPPSCQPLPEQAPRSVLAVTCRRVGLAAGGPAPPLLERGRPLASTRSLQQHSASELTSQLRDRARAQPIKHNHGDTPPKCVRLRDGAMA